MLFWKRRTNVGKQAAALLAQGQQAMHEGRPEDALLFFEQCVALEPDNGMAWSSLGQALLDVQRLPEAITALEHAVRFTPKDVAAWYNQALARRKLGAFDAALLNVEQALRLNSRAWLAWHEKGIILCQNTRPEQIEHIGEAHVAAFEAFSQATELRPDDTSAWLWRGRLAWRLTHSVQARERLGMPIKPNAQFYFAAALASFDQVLAQHPDDPATLFDKGRTLKDFGQYAEAREVFKHLTDIVGHAGDWYQLALVNNALGDNAAMYTSLAEAFALEPVLRADAASDFAEHRADPGFKRLLEG